MARDLRMELAHHTRDLENAHDALLSVPRGPVELTHLCVRSATDSGCLASVAAPQGAHATDVSLVCPSFTYGKQGDDAAIVSLHIPVAANCASGEQELISTHLALLCHAEVSYRASSDQASRIILATTRPGAGCIIDVIVKVPADAPGGASATLESVRVAGRLLAIPTPAPSIVVYSGPPDVSPEQATLLQAWVGCSSRPETWNEVFRATRDGFGADEFHARCDNAPRLLVLIRERKHGWLFGGYTSVGWLVEHNQPIAPRYADPDAFLFSLTNPAGCPEKLEAQGKGREMTYQEKHLATFGVGADMVIKSGADVDDTSWTCPSAFGVFRSPTPPSTFGPYPMCIGDSRRFCISELVVFAVPEERELQSIIS